MAVEFVCHTILVCVEDATCFHWHSLHVEHLHVERNDAQCQHQRASQEASRPAKRPARRLALATLHTTKIIAMRLRTATRAGYCDAQVGQCHNHNRSHMLAPVGQYHNHTRHELVFSAHIHPSHKYSPKSSPRLILHLNLRLNLCQHLRLYLHLNIHLYFA